MSDKESLTDSGEDEDEEEEEEEEDEDEEEEEDESGDDEDIDEGEEEEEAIEEEEDEEEEEEQEEEEDDDEEDEESDTSEQGSDEERDENVKRQTVKEESSETEDSADSEEEVQKSATKTAKDESIKSVTNLERKNDAREPFNTDVTNNKLRENAKEPIESVKTNAEVRSDATEPIKSVVTNSEVRAVDSTISRDSHPKVFQSISQETQTDEDSFVAMEIIQRNEGENLAHHGIVNEPPVPKPELRDAFSITDDINRKDVETFTEALPDISLRGIDQLVQTEEIQILSPHVTPYVTSERSRLSQAENGGAVRQPSLREEMAPLSSIDSHRYTSDKTIQVNYSELTSFRRVGTQTKLKHYNVRTITSGLIKRRTMQTCTSGLISKPEQKDRGTNTAGTALRTRGTQTKDKYLSETKPPNKEVAEVVTSKPSKKSRKVKVPKLKLTPDLDENSNETKVSRDLQQKSTPPESPTERDSGSRDIKNVKGSRELNGKGVENESGEESNKKIRKERENVRRRGRRRREILFMPVRQSLDWRPRTFPQRKPPPRPKSAKLLPRRKPVLPDGRPVSVAQYRMLYHHRWPECPF